MCAYMNNATSGIERGSRDCMRPDDPQSQITIMRCRGFNSVCKVTIVCISYDVNLVGMDEMNLSNKSAKKIYHNNISEL